MTQSTKIQNGPVKMGSVVRLLSAFLTIRPCSYEELPDRYLLGILYGIGIVVFRITLMILYVAIYVPQQTESTIELVAILSVFRGVSVFLSTLVFSALASWLFGRSHTPQTYSLWIGTWTYIPVIIPLYLWSERAGDCFGFVLCVINACMLNSFANAKTPFGGWCGYILHFLYCYWALAFNCLVYVSD